MLKDFRQKRTAPDEKESDWMQTHPIAILARVLVLAGIALAIAVSTSEALKSADPPPAARPGAASR